MGLLHEERENMRPNNYREREAYKKKDMSFPRMTNKGADRVVLEKQVKEFLESGGEITIVQDS